MGIVLVVGKSRGGYIPKSGTRGRGGGINILQKKLDFQVGIDTKFRVGCANFQN